MITPILSKFVGTVMFLSSVAMPHAHGSTVALTQVLPEHNHVGYRVIEGDTLASIAKDYFGDAAYWTTLMNDNPQVSDPDNLVLGSFIQIRTNKPEQPEALARKDAVPQEVAAIVRHMDDTPSVTPAQAVAMTNAPHTLSDEAINSLGSCEAGLDPAKNTGNGYYGAFQFSAGTWNRMNTGYARADLAPLEVQKAAVQQLLSRSSIYSQFPACSRKMHSEGII